MLIAFASALHHKGKRVRILDLDSQGTLSGWLDDENGLPTIPADELLIEAGQFAEEDAENARLAYSHILEAEKAGGYDYLLIDTKGEPSMTAAVTMAVADMVLCPSDGSSAEYEPIMVTFKSCEAALLQIGSDADPQDKFRVVFTRQSIAQSSGIQRGKQALAKHFRCVGGIADSAAVDDAHRAGTTIGRLLQYGPTGPSVRTWALCGTIVDRSPARRAPELYTICPFVWRVLYWNEKFWLSGVCLTLILSL